MTVPVSGQTLNGAFVYQVLLNANVATLLGVTAALQLTGPSGSTVTFGTNTATNPPVETITYTTPQGTFTQNIDTTGDSQQPTAFTYTSGGNTYIVSNGPVTAPVADVTVGGLTALLGGLGDLGLTPGATNYVPCYLAGTRIATPDGETAVEDLAAGDLVVTASGQSRAIRWVGRRAYAGRFLAANPGVQPVRFRAGSLGENLPRRDLLVSPDHAMFLGGVLVAARCLVNGVTIVGETGLKQVEYVHIELDSHDLLLAEGAPSESFVDDDSRTMFHNATEWAEAHPGQARVPAVFCAPRIESGAELAAIRRQLSALLPQAVQAA